MGERKDRKILIVEDETLICKELEILLKHIGYRLVQIAHNYEEAIRIFREFQPDLAIIDIKLESDKSGTDVAEAIRKEREIPIIYVTAYTDSATFLSAIETEPYAYLTKPIKNSELRSAIEIAFYKHQAYLKIKESEIKFRALFENANDAIVILNQSLKISNINQKASELYGYNLGEINGLDYRAILPEIEISFDNKQKICLKKSDNDSLSTAIETKGVKKNSTTFDCEVSISAIDSKSHDAKYFFIIRDITEKKKYEDYIKQTNKELELKVIERTKTISALVRQAPFPIAILNENFELLEANPTWLNFYSRIEGFSPKDYSLKNDVILNRSKLVEFILNSIETQGFYKTRAIYVDFKEFGCSSSEEPSFVIYNIYAIKENNEKISRIISLIQDLTDMMKAQEAEEKIKRQKQIIAEILERIEIEKERISKDLHDGAAQLLFAAKLNLEMFEKEAKVHSQKLTAAKSLIAQALEEIRNSVADMRSEELEKFGLKKAIERLLDNVRKNLNCAIIADLSDLSERFDRKKELQIYRIIQEALNNISNHSKAKAVFIEAKILDKILYLKIEDDGIGFVSENFEIDNTQKFGLKNMKERTEQLNGKFELYSFPNKGTKIYIQIPIRESHVVELKNSPRYF